jgi:hypothetical protein
LLSEDALRSAFSDESKEDGPQMAIILNALSFTGD